MRPPKRESQRQKERDQRQTDHQKHQDKRDQRLKETRRDHRLEETTDYKSKSKNKTDYMETWARTNSSPNNPLTQTCINPPEGSNVCHHAATTLCECVNKFRTKRKSSTWELRYARVVSKARMSPNPGVFSKAVKNACEAPMMVRKLGSRFLDAAFGY